MVEPQKIASSNGLDLEHRDPNNKNIHTRVFFEDAFAEPEGTHSLRGVWSCSYKTFKGVRSCCYIFLSILCGGPCACMWGTWFAMQSFYHIWCVGPSCKCWDMDFACYAYWYRTCVECTFNPFYDAVGRMFSKIRFHHRYEVV